MDSKEEKEIEVKEVIRKVPQKSKRAIKIQFPNPIKLLIYGVIVFILLGGSILGITRVLKSQEKVFKLGFEDVGELVTQTCHTVVLEDSKENRTFFKLFDIPFTESRQIFSYDFDVDASIDFSKISLIKIDDNKKEIHIQLPHSQVYKVVLLPRTFRSYLDQDSPFSRIDMTEHNDALIKMEDTAENQCLVSNLLERADDNAQKLITAMIKSEKEYRNYKIIYDYINNK